MAIQRLLLKNTAIRALPLSVFSESCPLLKPALPHFTLHFGAWRHLSCCGLIAPDSPLFLGRYTHFPIRAAMSLLPSGRPEESAQDSFWIDGQMGVCWMTTASHACHDEAAVLLVDDEVGILEEYREWFALRGINCSIENDALNACDLIIRSPRIKVVVTDLRMPGLNGADMIARGGGAQSRPAFHHLFRLLRQCCARCFSRSSHHRKAGRS